MHTINLNKQQLNDQNTKQMLLLHGYGNSNLSYYKIINELSYKYNTYSIDLLGMGLSSRPKYEIKNPKETIEFFVESIE